VVGMLKDKDIAGVLSVMQNSINHWHVAALNTPRSASTQCLVEHLTAMGVGATHIYTYDSIKKAYEYLLFDKCLPDGDRIIVFGSFYTVAEVLRQCH
jgi:dihydrofolate synthase/folylpolyglutamate synthase